MANGNDGYTRRFIIHIFFRKFRNNTSYTHGRGTKKNIERERASERGREGEIDKFSLTIIELSNNKNVCVCVCVCPVFSHFDSEKSYNHTDNIHRAS